jgi:hypothetical protein
VVDSGLGADTLVAILLCDRGDSQHGVVLDLGLSEGRAVSGDEDEFS